MRFVIFKKDIFDNEKIVWRKNYLYKILSETEDQIILDSDCFDDEKRGVNICDLSSLFTIYKCSDEINYNCQYCKWLFGNEDNQYCGVKFLSENKK